MSRYDSLTQGQTTLIGSIFTTSQDDCVVNWGHGMWTSLLLSDPYSKIVILIISILALCFVDNNFSPGHISQVAFGSRKEFLC